MIRLLAARFAPARWLARADVARGHERLEAGRPQEALDRFERALARRSLLVEALHGRGLALGKLGRHVEAVASFDKVLAIQPDHRDALYHRGNAQIALAQPMEALGSYERALRSHPIDADLLYNRGVALQALARHDEAIDSYDRVLRLTPQDAQALNNRGIALMQLQRRSEASDSFRQALHLAPRWPDALHNHALSELELKRPAQAAEALEKLLSVAPDYPFARGKLLHARMLACDWRDGGAALDGLMKDVAAGQRVAAPFELLGLSADRAALRRCAEVYAHHHHPVPAVIPRHATKRRTGPIRIGYVSGELRQQATSVLIVELIELHDRGRFEIIGFDNGWDDQSPMRRRLASAFDAIVPIRSLDDAAAAEAVAARGIDILVDLNGYFGLQRRGVFARRPSPVQVNYLGFPGTLGASDMDYIVADPIVIPPEHAADYSESVVCLPDTYQPNDRRRVIDSVVVTRAECQLPESAFVFCCFNNNFKITPDVFDVWMRLLQKLPGSVLWLLEDNPSATANLRRAAASRGVEEGRLVSAPRMELARHLARQRSADLFLDTLPCNAHTTASDALWAGLPLITCLGEAFAGRVSASLLHAVGLPELVTRSLTDYETMALELARAPDRLQALRDRLARRRDDSPLFDSPRYARHLESAYETMHDRMQRGLAPAGFAVEPLA